MKDFMIDLETMGTGQDCVILSIGAVRFDPETGEIDKNNTFYRRLNWRGQPGRVIDPNTLDWWLKQDPAVMKEAMGGDCSLTMALRDLQQWMGGGHWFHNSMDGIRAVWANGVSFDLGILSHAYKAADLTRPWSYSKETCMRTLRRLVDLKDFPRVGDHHNALDDAMYQAQWVVAAVQALKRWNIASAAHGAPCSPWIDGSACPEHSDPINCKRPYRA